MLLEGTLQSWNDERGFGFIAPDGGGPPVFVHISAFQNTAARPQARQRLSYVLDKPAGDKPRASRARVLGVAVSQSPHATRPRPAATRPQRQAAKAPRSTSSGGAALLFIPALAVLLLVLGLSFGSTWRAAGWYVLASLVTFAWYAWDKAAAQQGHWRTPEKHLWLLGLLGGWPGALLQIDAQEGEIGQPVQPLQALADYVLRVYLLRSLVIVAVALVAVRLAMRPLQRLAAAAEALGRNLQSPPMDARGPREVQQAAQAFNAMQQKINEGLAERTRFLAAVSHDLRSPITRLRLRAEMLEPDALRAKFRKDLEEMEHMVASTLDMLTGAHASGPRQTMDIHALVHGVAQDMHESSGLPVPVSGQALQPYTGYAQSLRRGLQNLVENALRYAGDAQLHIDDDGQQLRIHVRDHGPGIPAAQMERVLEPFYRMEHSRNADSGGVGLGLSIAQTVAQAHGGELLLRVADGGGLEAVLVLPRGDAAALIQSNSV